MSRERTAENVSSGFKDDMANTGTSSWKVGLERTLEYPWGLTIIFCHPKGKYKIYKSNIYIFKQLYLVNLTITTNIPLLNPFYFKYKIQILNGLST